MPWQRASRAVFGLWAAFVAACAPAPLTLSSHVVIRGSARLANGSPAAKASLRLRSAPDAICRHFAEVATGSADSNGDFSITVDGASVLIPGLGPGEVANRCVELELAAADGTGFATQFFVVETDVSLSPISLWAGDAGATVTPGIYALAFDPTPPIDSQQFGFGGRIVSNGQLVASELNGPAGTAEFSTVLLEDFSQPAAVPLAYSNHIEFSSPLVDRWYGAATPVPALGRVPLTRGSPCQFPNQSGGCQLTDGSLEQTWFDPPLESITVSLPQPTVIRLIALRGMALDPPLGQFFINVCGSATKLRAGDDGYVEAWFSTEAFVSPCGSFTIVGDGDAKIAAMAEASAFP